MWDVMQKDEKMFLGHMHKFMQFDTGHVGFATLTYLDMTLKDATYENKPQYKPKKSLYTNVQI